MLDWVRHLARRRFPRGPRSQGGQDGILGEIFRHIPTTNAPPVCVEFGFNSATLTGGTGSNVASLVVERGWHALLLDCAHENPAINLCRTFLTSANIVEVFAAHGVPSSPDYISIDVDSTDLWLFRALLARFRASAFSVEYNSHFPLHLSVTCIDDPEARWRSDRAYGASLRALVTVACEHGYSLVAVEPGLDAFFVRNDLIDDGSGEIAPPLAHWRPATLLPIHPPVQDEARLATFLDYDVWRRTGGNLESARQAAMGACRMYLAADRRILRVARIVDRCAGRWRGYSRLTSANVPDCTTRPCSMR